MRFQVVTPVGAVFAIGTGEPTGTTVVVSTDVGRKVGTSGEGPGTEGTEEWARIFAMSGEVDLERGTENGCE